MKSTSLVVHLEFEEELCLVGWCIGIVCLNLCARGRCSSRRMSCKMTQVCGEPKIFVGQIPLETSKDEILEVFSAFGAIKNVSIMSTPEGRSKGCAMILYEKWSQAEVAIEACHGKSFFGTNRALVVNLADPPRRGGGAPAIAPKTLFVGQVPKTTEDEEVRKLFEPFGEILESHVSRKGSVSGCAFVKFNLWSEAESAMEALHGRHTLPGAKNPLVVKFADAKTKDPVASITSNSLLPLGLKQHHPLLDSDWQSGTKLAFQSSVSGTGFSYNENSGAWAQSPGPLAAAVHPYQSLSRGLGFNPNSPTNGHPPLASVYGMNGSPYFSAFGNGSRAGPPPPPPYSTSSPYASTMLVGGATTQPIPPPGILNTSMGGIMSVAATAGSDFNLSLPPMGPKESAMQSTTIPSLDSKVNLNGAKLGPGISDPRANEWKLFVGQVPFDCTEQDLWPIFSDCGEILELVILRSEGRSKGCAFVTYSDKETAEAAANYLNGQVTVPNDRRGKRLVVRFAEKKKEINWNTFAEDIKTE